MFGILGNGQVGQHLAEAFDYMNLPNHLIGRKVDEKIEKYRETDVVFDVSSALPEDLYQLSDNYNVLIYTSAYRDVAKCEDDPALADRINWLVPATLSNHKPIVYISTDYVFGKLNTDYPRPITGKIGEGEDPDSKYFSGGAPSVYGQSKRRGEQAVIGSGSAVVRIGSPFGKWKSPLRHSFVDMVQSNFSTMTLPRDQIVSPTYLPQAAERIAMLATDMQPGVYHAVCEGSASFMDIATWVRSVIKSKHKVLGKYSDPVEDRLRPNYSALQNNKLPKLWHWAEAVDQYLRRG
jgi:dTDP-4-dehydrorhamnose reductase